MNNNPVISLNNVSRVYQQGEIEVIALKDVTLQVRHGEFLSLCGPSGSGKTTLLNLIGGLDLATSGRVIVDDRELGGMSRGELAEMRLNHLGFIFQAYNLIPVLTARENVEFVMELQGINASERRKKSLDILREVGLAGLEDRKPGELSGGQQQRVAVARAIVSHPSIVLADEPTANLDSKTAESLLELMQTMNSEHNVTFVFSTHDALVMSYAKRIIKLKDGSIVSDSAT